MRPASATLPRHSDYSSAQSYGRSTPPDEFNARNGLAITAPREGPDSLTRNLKYDMPVNNRSLSDPSMGAPESRVMHDTLNVIQEHISNLHTPRQSMHESAFGTNESGSEYSSQADNPAAYINGAETDEEVAQHHTPVRVKSWSPSQVAEYLEELGVERRHCEVFQEQEVSGEVLLEIDQASLFMKEFDLGPIGRRLRTWHKIRAFQAEVRGNASKIPKAISRPPSERGETSIRQKRSRRVTETPSLPQTPNVNATAPYAEDPARELQTDDNASVGLDGGSEIPSSPAFSKKSSLKDDFGRPSTSSVRHLHDGQRHSYVDRLGSPLSPAEQKYLALTELGPSHHRKQPSFDRSWTMTDAVTSARAGLGPLGGAHMHTMSMDRNQSQVNHALGLTGLTDVSSKPADLDRGYFSGGEVDSRQSRRTLRKREKEAGSRKRTSSVHTEKKRASIIPQHLRIGSVDSAHVIGPRISAAAQTYYNMAKRKGRRATSGPDLSHGVRSDGELSPTVTRLNFEISSPTIDSVAFPSRPADNESSIYPPSSPSVTQTPSLAFRGHETDHRFSDIIGDSEKSFASASSEVLPALEKEVPRASPVVPTAAQAESIKSTELDSPVVSKSPFMASKMSPLASTAVRRKSKKHTSAYTRGLEKKTPEEKIQDCDYSGWMKKRSSNLMTTWKSRLFVLKGRRLSYYYSERDTEEKGVIDISSHRVLPANDERITGFHATITGASTSPTSPKGSRIVNALPGPEPTLGTEPAAAEHQRHQSAGASGMFIFKLVPPRTGLSKAVNFTKPTIHYFAVDSVHIGRLWMAALMKATIDRVEDTPVLTTYHQKTISLAKAKATRQRPPALMNLAEENEGGQLDDDDDDDDGGGGGDGREGSAGSSGGGGGGGGSNRATGGVEQDDSLGWSIDSQQRKAGRSVDDVTRQVPQTHSVDGLFQRSKETAVNGNT